MNPFGAVLHQRHGGQGGMARVEPDELLQVELQKSVSVQADEPPPYLALRGLQLASRPQRVLRGRVVYLDSQLGSVLEVFFDEPAQISGRNDDLRDPALPQPLDDVLQNRLLPDREHRLRQDERVRPEPGPEAPGQNDRLEILATQVLVAWRPGPPALLYTFHRFPIRCRGRRPVPLRRA